MGRALCWLRRDLRVHDHRALAAACRSGRQVAVVFIYDTCILDALQNKQDRRVQFIVSSLDEVDAELRKFGSGLVTRIGDPVVEIPKLAAEFGAESVYTAEDFEPYARTRDGTNASPPSRNRRNESGTDRRTSAASCTSSSA